MLSKILTPFYSAYMLLKKQNKIKDVNINPVKHYTFMVEKDGLQKHRNVIARNRTEAEFIIKQDSPASKISFLWEYVRRADDGFLK